MNKINLKYLISVAIIVGVVLLVGIALFNSESSQKESLQSTSGLEAMIGKPFPGVQLFDKDGKIYTPDSFKGKNTVLFFNEGIMCYPACWDEMAALATDSRFNSDNTQIISVVTDSPSQWVSPKEQMPDLAKANILFDQGAAVSRQLGIVNLHSSMHVGSMPGHTYIVLDKQGVVRYVFDDPNMAKNGDKLAAEIFKFNN